MEGQYILNMKYSEKETIKMLSGFDSNIKRVREFDQEFFDYYYKCLKNISDIYSELEKSMSNKGKRK